MYVERVSDLSAIIFDVIAGFSEHLGWIYNNNLIIPLWMHVDVNR